MNSTQLERQNAKIFDIAEKASSMGVAHLTGDGATYTGRKIKINGKEHINFSSCSYLGLSLDQRVIEGAMDGVKRFGTSFPTSRSFLTLGYLEELEHRLESLFGYSCILTSTTSLAHTAVLPVFLTSKDVFICDHQVHTSVQVASEIVRAKGCESDMIRHNDLDKLEEKIIAYEKTHRQVWYLADGIYSMYGDTSPIKELRVLLEKYHNFHVYIDDAHGMSWTGENGKGHVLNQEPLHPRMILSTSLGKAFGSIGGVIVCNHPDVKKIIKSCGSAFIFSSPLPPSVIGASIASADIHLSNEIEKLQSALVERIDFFREQALTLGMPVLGKGNTPIFFIPSGNPDTCFEIAQRMMTKGFYQSTAVYPSVPINCAGVRFTVTNWLELADIQSALETLSIERRAVLEQHKKTEYDVKRFFKGIEYSLQDHNLR